MNKSFKHLYPDEYFRARGKNDIKRLISFDQERQFMQKYADFSGSIFDVGCSTGEFLEVIDWKGKKYGSEISDLAILEAEKTGINFSTELCDFNNELDAVVFRGTIQHIPDPFAQIKDAYNALKPGGHLFFLATPNAASAVYKISGTLPFLVPKLNFYIPSAHALINACENFGFIFKGIEKPYIHSPYKNLFADHLKFMLLLLGVKGLKFSFWGNMINVSLEKPVINE
jgi:SAM-dependent methyltransferase